VLSILDRRDGGAYDQRDVMRAESFAELALVALEHDPSALGELAV
jgi:hypothetical protein